MISPLPPSCPKGPGSAFGAWSRARARAPASSGSKAPAPASPLWALPVALREGARVGVLMPAALAEPARAAEAVPPDPAMGPRGRAAAVQVGLEKAGVP